MVLCYGCPRRLVLASLMLWLQASYWPRGKKLWFDTGALSGYSKKQTTTTNKKRKEKAKANQINKQNPKTPSCSHHTHCAAWFGRQTSSQAWDMSHSCIVFLFPGPFCSGMKLRTGSISGMLQPLQMTWLRGPVGCAEKENWGRGENSRS